jgi:hypothetical protein
MFWVGGVDLGPSEHDERKNERDAMFSQKLPVFFFGNLFLCVLLFSQISPLSSSLSVSLSAFFFLSPLNCFFILFL